jgi:hypothetical protein
MADVRLHICIAMPIIWKAKIAARWLFISNIITEIRRLSRV